MSGETTERHELRFEEFRFDATMDEEGEVWVSFHEGGKCAFSCSFSDLAICLEFATRHAAQEPQLARRPTGSRPSPERAHTADDAAGSTQRSPAATSPGMSGPRRRTARIDRNGAQAADGSLYGGVARRVTRNERRPRPAGCAVSP